MDRKAAQRGRDGFVLPAVILFIVFSLAMGMAVLELGRIEIRSAARRGHREAAFYLAEAGLARALAHILEDPDWEPEAQDVALGSGAFAVSMTPLGPNATLLRSTGTVGQTQETVQVVINHPEGGGLFAHGIFGGTEVKMYGSSEIHGYDSRDGSTQDAFVGSIYLVEVVGNCSVFGHGGVTSDGQIIVPAWKPNAITGDLHYDYKAPSMPSVVIPEALTTMPYTQIFDTGLGGNYQIDNNHNFAVGQWPRVASISSGRYRFNDFSLMSDAQLTISGTVRLLIEGKLWMPANAAITLQQGASLEIYLGPDDGELVISGSSRINKDGISADVGIYSASDKTITLSGNVLVCAAIYAPDADVVLEGSSPLYGGVVSNSIKMLGNVKIFHDVALSELPAAGESGGELEIKNWSKADWNSPFSQPAGP